MALWINESVSSLSDFMTKLNTFLTTAGAGNPAWSADQFSTGTGVMAVSKDDAGTGESVEVAFQWDPSSPSSLGIYQYVSGSGAGNYNTGVSPWQQTADCGNGAASASEASINAGRLVYLTNSPDQYWCFTGDTWAYVVVQVSATFYQHFGFGVLTKFNDWDGGAFAYGQLVEDDFGSDPSVQIGSTALLDGLCADGTAPNPTNNQELRVATLHVENLPGQPSGGMWAVVMGNQTDLGADRQGTPKDRCLFIGGFRGGEIARSMGIFVPSPITGFVPAYPIATMYYDRTTPAVYGPMGIMPGVRGINIDQFAAGDSIVIGADTWYAFPTVNKASGAGNSSNQGILYLAN